MKNKVLILICLFITLIVCFPIKVYAFEECQSNAKSFCVIEQSSGRVLYGKDIDKKLPMASLTKIFTALTVLENCNNLNAKVLVDDKAVGIEGTSIYLRKGETLTVEELLFGMMLPSGNDAATALAYFVGGDISSFCKLMEKTAKNAGAKNSSFKNPHGLDEEGHFTTAYDLAKVSAKALENEKFLEIVSTKNISISGNEEVEKRYLRNKNKLLSSFDGCNGVKTGFTDNAGRCFVSSATRDNMTVVCSVLNCGPMFEECAKFMEKSFENFKLYNILPEYNIYRTLPVEKGKQKEVELFTQKCFCYPLTQYEYAKLHFEYNIPNSLTAPLKKEQIVGKISIYLENEKLFEDNILTMTEVKKDCLVESVKDIIKNWN